MSAGEACGEMARSAGCGSSAPMIVVQPSYDTPSMPTRPLFFGTFLSSHSIVSQVSVPSSSERVSPCARAGRCITNCPSEPNFPRMSWNAKM
jgi:hypothetical protein